MAQTWSPRRSMAHQPRGTSGSSVLHTRHEVSPLQQRKAGVTSQKPVKKSHDLACGRMALAGVFIVYSCS